ncbi:MAG: glycosyltransferase family 2 protein [Methanobacterium sp.]|nr:glycosyltransferase family 2 protein [Methanobacterium sp.]
MNNTLESSNKISDDQNNNDPNSFDSIFKLLQSNIYVVIPAYNENKTIKRVIENLKDKRLNIIIVDDGSTDKTYKIAKNAINGTYNSYIYRHIINRGLGAALKTGIDVALSKNADIIVTFDADDQHDVEDIFHVSKPIIDGAADIVIGKRNFEEMPLSKKLGNQVMNIITRIFYGIHVNDSQSGLRAFNRKAAEVLDIHSRGYGVSSEIIGEIKKYNLKLEEINIKTIYTDYSMSKGTNLKVGLKILFKLIINAIKKVL